MGKTWGFVEVIIMLSFVICFLGVCNQARSDSKSREQKVADILQRSRIGEVCVCGDQGPDGCLLVGGRYHRRGSAESAWSIVHIGRAKEDRLPVLVHRYFGDYRWAVVTNKRAKSASSPSARTLRMPDDPTGVSGQDHIRAAALVAARCYFGLGGEPVCVDGSVKEDRLAPLGVELNSSLLCGVSGGALKLGAVAFLSDTRAQLDVQYEGLSLVVHVRHYEGRWRVMSVDPE